MSKRIVEVCVDGVDSAINAKIAGADRLEVCQDLQIGGTTPSYGLLKSIVEAVDLPVVAMLRPRAADFCYSKTEYAVMLNDIEVFKGLGVGEIVTGILTPDGALDKARMAQIIALAHPAKVVLHRAFDMTSDLNKALCDATELGIARILTSGGAVDVKSGMQNLKALIAQSNGVEIMPGGGVNSEVVDQLIAIGAKQIHLSGKVGTASAMTYKNPCLSMGSNESFDEYAHHMTSVEIVRAVVKAFNIV